MADPSMDIDVPVKDVGRFFVEKPITVETQKEDADTDKETDKDTNKEKERDKDKDREKDKDKSSSRDKKSSRHRSRERDHKERRDKDRSSRDHDKDRDRHRSSRHRSRSKEKEKEKDKDKEKERDDKDKKRPREESATATEEANKKPKEDDAPPADPEKAKLLLEEEMRKRRERVEQWRREREAAAKGSSVAEPSTANAPTNENGEGASSSNDQVESMDIDQSESDAAKKWSLEDDEEDEVQQDEDHDESESTKNTATIALPPPVDLPAIRSIASQKEEDEPSLVRATPLVGTSTKPLFSIKSSSAIVGPSSSTPAAAPATKITPSAINTVAKGSKAVPQKSVVTALPAENEAVDDDDALEAYMSGVHQEVQKLTAQDAQKLHQFTGKGKAPLRNSVDSPSDRRSQSPSHVDVRVVESDEEAELEEQVQNPDDNLDDLKESDILALAQKQAKKKELAAVDHSKMQYEPFKRDFYIESPDIVAMTEEDVIAYREELDGIKIRGQNCPKPIKKWTHCGLNMKILDIIKKNNWEKPTPIQAQAIPAIMSGRDVIGIARTGSGKTLAFVLPMLRHIMDQRPLDDGEGPIALILTPTRELAVQTLAVCKTFTKVLKLRPVCAYGGTAIKDQIADLKRGAEIVVCTPGRMIDLLAANSGRVTNLTRVTYLVLDEADRMFDMGFEPQVMKIINNIRPDKQIVLFSATFPKQMEALARRALNRPLEIQVGGRSVVSADVSQHVEVLDEQTKFLRLLELLGQKFDPEKRVLVFVDRQDAADSLFHELSKRGYVCKSLHGGMDQSDRDDTLNDFKAGNFSLMIATSIAARGLDVKLLHLVINYEVPNHYEDYVHRCGRTGRAGNKGEAYTFISPDQDKFAGDIIKALEASKQPVPTALQALWDGFKKKVGDGKAQFHGSGFGGKGLEKIDKAHEMVRKVQKLTYGGNDDPEPEEEPVEDEEGSSRADTKVSQGLAIRTPGEITHMAGEESNDTLIKPALATAVIPNVTKTAPLSEEALKAQKLAEERARALQAKLAEKGVNMNLAAAAMAPVAAATAAATENKFFAEIEINDFPQHARWKVTNKDTILNVCEYSGAAVTTRGSFFGEGQKPKEGDRKLYLLIEATTQQSVERAATELKRVLKEATVSAIERANSHGTMAGKYKVV